MDSQRLRAMAVAVRDDIREQLRRWAEDFDAEAEAVERGARRTTLSRDRS